MIEVRNFDEIVQNLINAIHDKVPEADSKEGTFIRDVFIDPIADEMSALSIDMKNVEYSQSILTATGEDLDRLAVNYGITRKSAQSSTGYIRFYVKNINTDFIINAQTQLATKATYTSEAKVYQTVNTKTYYYIHDWQYPPVDVDSEEFKNQYIAIYSNNLTLGTNGYYYFDVEAKSTLGGELYNTSADTIVSTIDNVDANIAYFTNPIAFTGGTNQESDANLTVRIKMALQGANIGTKYGYTSYVLKQQDVIDAQVVCAMEQDMIRDVYKDNVAHHGGKYGVHDGGKVDIYIRGRDLEDDTLTIQLNEDNVIFTDDGFETPLVIPDNLKPISNIKSITYKTTNGLEEKTGVFTNESDYQYELTKITFSELDTIENDSLKDLINTIIEKTEMMSIDKSRVDDIQITVTTGYGSLNEIQTIQYGGELITLSYAYYMDEFSEPVYCPVMFYTCFDSNSNIIKLEIYTTEFNEEFYSGPTYNVYELKNGYHYEIQTDSITGKVEKVEVPNDPVYMLYNRTADGTKNYFKDSLYDDSYFFADSVEDLAYNEHLLHILEESNCTLEQFYDYINQSEVKQFFLNNLNNLAVYMKDYLYYLDFGKANTETTLIEAIPNLYANNNESTPNFSFMEFYINNNSNINELEFDVVIDNSNDYFITTTYDEYDNPINELPVGWTDNNGILVKHFTIDSQTLKNYRETQQAEHPDTELQVIRLNPDNLDEFKLVEGATTFTLQFENVLIKDVFNNVLQYKTTGIIKESNTAIETPTFLDNLFNLTTYIFNNEIYKARFDFFINENITVPLYVTRKNNNIVLHTYYTPDYELINAEQLFFGNSQQAQYYLKWYTNPLDILEGNIYIIINFEKNVLIQNLQEEINEIKVLTADVVLKEAEVIPVEIICSVKYEDTYSKKDTYDLINSTVANYINNTAMGKSLKLSDLIIMIQHIDGVGYIDASNVQLRELYKDAVKQIDLHSYEYLNLVNLVINEIEGD